MVTQEPKHVELAPEPCDIFWANLALSRTYRRRAACLTYTLTAALLAISFALLLAADVAQAYAPGWVDVDLNEAGKYEALAFTASLAMVSAGITVVINQLLKVVIILMTKREGKLTRTDYERSVFTKLILAYALNTILAPIIVARFTVAIARPVVVAWLPRYPV